MIVLQVSSIIENIFNILIENAALLVTVMLVLYLIISFRYFRRYFIEHQMHQQLMLRDSFFEERWTRDNEKVVIKVDEGEIELSTDEVESLISILRKIEEVEKSSKSSKSGDISKNE